MKKVITTLLFLMGIVGTTSATDYALYVAGKQVTSSNAKNIMTGVSYDASKKVLTLDNAKIEATKDNVDGIWNTGIDGLTIKIVGSATIKSTNGNGICMANTTIITSDNYASLYVYGSEEKTGKCAIWMQNGNELYIKKLWVYVYGGYYGLCGTSSTHNETLHLYECAIFANLKNSAATGSAVSGWKEIGLSGVTYDYNGNKYNTSTYAMTDSKDKNVQSCWIYGRLCVGRNIIDPRSDRTLTSSNTEAGITKGTVKWVAASKELQLIDATIAAPSSFTGISFYGYYNSSDPLNIWVSGTNSITTTQGGRPIYSHKDKLTIDGQSRTSAKLALNCDNVSGIYCGGSSLSIGTIGLYVKSKASCLNGSGSTQLLIGTESGGSKIDLETTSNQATLSFKSCTMKNDATSNGTYFNAAKTGFTVVGGTLAKIVNIDQPTTSYDCHIYGYELNNVNCNNFACEGMESGTIKWDNATKTLSLNDVKLNNTSVTNQAAIRPGGIVGNTVTLNISGSNSIKGGHSSLYPGGNLIIKGKGSLTCENTGVWGAILHGGNGTVTIDVDGKVYFKGKYGYNTNNGSNSTNKLVLKSVGFNSDYTFEGTTAAITGLYGGLTLTDIDFYSNSSNGGVPGCYFDTEDHRVEQNGGATAKMVNFYKPSEKYDLYVGKTQVTNCNRSGIGSKYISSGTKSVTYDNTNNILTLNNAAITANGMNIIENKGIDNLTISLQGKSVLSRTDTDGAVIGLEKNTTISGGSSMGQLEVKGNTTMGICARKEDLTIKNAKLNMSNSLYSNDSYHTNSLTIDNSTVEVNNRVSGFKNVYLANTYLIEPNGGKYNTSTYLMEDKNGKGANYVLFGPQELLGIENMEADTTDGKAEVKHIYDTNGSEQGEMKRGVNIIRMSDGTVRKVIKK